MIRLSIIHAIFCISLASFFVLAAGGVSRAAETISNYHSRIRIQPTGDLLITETIDVIAEGDQIVHGIYRDLPRYRRMSLGGILPMDYEFHSVRREGMDEPYFIAAEGNYLRLYAGDADRILSPNRYQYEIRYEVRNQVMFFPAYDELNWNVVGTGWAFPINRTETEIILPGGAPVENYSVYTGPVLAQEGQYQSIQSTGKLYVLTEQALAPGEGVTIALSWPKSFVEQAEPATGWPYFLKQHPGLTVAGAAWLATSVFYLLAWGRVGRDPRRKRLAPFYVPPKGVSPAMAAYIQSMGDADSDRCLTAAIISLAAQGYFIIEEAGKGIYTLIPTGKDAAAGLPEDEKLLLERIRKKITLKAADSFWESLSEQHQEALESTCHEKYFFGNGWWWAAGVIPLLCACGLLFWQGLLSQDHLIILAMTVIGGEIVRLLLPAKLKKSAFFNALYALFLAAGGFFALLLAGGYLSWLTGFALVFAAAIILLMRPVMKAPTRAGIGVMEEIDGLQYYMEAVEEKILKKFDPPQMSRQLYEDYLPYAVALNVESQWAEKFVTAMAAATAGAAMVATQPHWFRGRDSSANVQGFSVSSMVNSFGNALSAASSSRSSSSGGGRVGSGGGGGGGGGW